MSGDLYAANSPAAFWKLTTRPEPCAEEWAAAAAKAADVLPAAALAKGRDLARLVEMTLGEGQFGPDHWNLTRARRLYYRLKPFIPRSVITGLRRAHRRAVEDAGSFELGWPVEDRYARFLWATLSELLLGRNQSEARFLSFWPRGLRSALVLTHDIETASGQAFVPTLAELEERLGFRSSFNFVAERYPLDHALIRELRSAGFEVGVHGLKHDGRLYYSRPEFERRARKINGHLESLQAVGFRSPLTHRNPEWMQSLEIEYDLSFFDTDPYEPLPGGTMSLWPFQLGRFVELPYTLVQDFTLMQVLGMRSAEPWLEKAAFIDRFLGMALVNTHPDYLKDGGQLRIYEEFLERMAACGDRWHALPRDVARWWRRRAAADSAASLDGAVEGVIRRDATGVLQVLPAVDAAPERRGGKVPALSGASKKNRSRSQFVKENHQQDLLSDSGDGTYRESRDSNG